MSTAMPSNALDLSVLVVARDAAGQLGECLASASFARETVVVLDRCTDRSAEIARQSGARVLEGSWPVEADRRNAGIALCTSVWILELDADERVSEALRRELPAAMGRAEHAFYYVPMHNYIGDVWVKHGWGAYNGVAAKPCLFRNGAKSWGAGEIHPSISLTGESGRLIGISITTSMPMSAASSAASTGIPTRRRRTSYRPVSAFTCIARSAGFSRAF